MNPILLIFLIFIGIYSSLSWLLPKLLAWLFKQKYHIKLQIGRIAIPKFILKDVNISKNGYSIHIDEVSFRSSFFNSDINKLLSIVVKDVRINNNVEEKKSAVVENILKPLLSKQNSRTGAQNTDDSNLRRELGKAVDKLARKKILDFRETKLPHSLLMFAQFMAIHIYNISVMVLHAEDHISIEHSEEGWLLHATANSLHIDGCCGGASTSLIVSANLVDGTTKLLPRKEHICLGELACGLVLEITLKASGPLAIEKVHATINKPTMSVHESLSSFLHEFRASHSVKKKRKPYDDEEPINGVMERLSPIIPKIFSLKIDTTTLTGIRYHSRTEFHASLQSLQINSRFSLVTGGQQNDVCSLNRDVTPQVYVAFQMDELKVHTNKDKLFYLNKLKLDAKLEKGILNLYLIMCVLSVLYNHNDVHRWWKINIKQKKTHVNKEKRKAEVPSWLSKFFMSCIVQGCAEFRSVSLHAKLSNSAAVGMGWGGLKVKLDQLLDSRGEAYTSTLPRLLLGSRHWSTELLIDSGWCSVGPECLSITEPPQKKNHTWGTTTFLSVALIKWGSHGTWDTKIEAMMDCLRVEWSTLVANTFLSLFECLMDYKTTPTSVKTNEETRQTRVMVAVKLALSHVNVFTLVDDSMCLMTRIDALTVDQTMNKIVTVLSGMKMVDMVPHGVGLTCQRAEEISITFFHVKFARFEYIPRTAKTLPFLDIQFVETVDVEWSANLHMKIYTLMNGIKCFKNELVTVLNRDTIVKDDEDMLEEKANTVMMNWCVSFKGDTAFGITLSSDNHLLLTSDDLCISKDSMNGLSIAWSTLKSILNDAEIINIVGFTMERVLEDANIRVERIANENFVLHWNKVWGITIESIHVVFPYKHRFAEAIQGEFVSLFKWLKIIHNYKKKSFTSDSPLPSDLQIKIDEFIIEMSDDPFEVKLRDNYELLEDEYKESKKRREMLDAKIQELCKGSLFPPPASKLESLYAALREKDAEIYIQRSKAAPEQRTRLVAMQLNALILTVLADPVLHGTRNCIDLMKDMDPDSPWPDDGLEFSTLWCRAISAKCDEWRLLLRDFPQPLLRMHKLHMFGTLMGAEAVAPARAYRTVTIEQGEPWGAFRLERSMMPLKFYYDLCCEMENYSYAFGPCWEPTMAQCNISFEQVSRPSLDPSVPLPWWDKVRLLMHGRLTANIKKCTCLLHASLDPYNTTEEMELTWHDLVLDWTNAKMVLCGTLNVYVRTASKYDDCRLVHVPRVKSALKLGWRTVANPYDHHSVVPCAPDRLPEYSSNQEHDSFRAFRSQGLDTHISFETKPFEGIGPVLLLYGSTLRWFSSLKLILSGVTRPTRRGAVFGAVRPRKLQLSRHYRDLTMALTLHNFQVCYWSSSSMQRGIELVGVRVTCGSELALSLVPGNDGLLRRPRAIWSSKYVNCHLANAEMWLKSALCTPPSQEQLFMQLPVEKCYCLSVGQVSYSRSPTHRLTVHDLRGAWTKINRDVAFALFDTYIKTQQLKKNLSTKALKEEDKPVESSKPREADVVSPPPSAGFFHGTSPGSMLAQLVAEAGGEPPIVFSDDQSEPHNDTAPQPHPLHDGDDTLTNWLIVLVNSQVLLAGCETRGYVIVCAARAELRQAVRPPTTAWSAALTSMQYYATVSHADHLHENIQWVSVDEIEDRPTEAKEISTLPDVPRLVGSGHSAGGVIGSTVGPSTDAEHTQLQRIVSRCACEFYYAWSDEEEGGTSAAHTWDTHPGNPAPLNTFKLMHHDLDVCTNSLQYAMLLDIVNNLVLFVEPERRRVLERRARVRFQLQLHKEDPRQPVLKLQTQIRENLVRLRRLEKESYLKRRALAESDSVSAAEELQTLDAQVNECKETVLSLGEELDAMLRAWHCLQPTAPPPAAPAPAHRLYEICFKSARWRLTDADGQLGIADLVLTNFLYTKTSRSDDSVEHQLEVGYMRVTNLLPREPFPEVLVAEEPVGGAPLSRRAALRVFCRDRPPVGGISVKEHLELNIVPIRIGLTKKFFNTMLKFCFPERDSDIESMEADDDDTVSIKSGSTASLAGGAGSSKKQKKKSKDSNFYVKIEQKDDVEKMKERAEKNKLFIYIKIPEVPVRVSYKGSKEKNLEDVRDMPLVLPTLEYHNVTWTWLDLLLATKNDTRRVILSQAIRQRLQLHRRAAAAPEPQEEDKARLLLGDITVAENKPQKKGVFKINK